MEELTEQQQRFCEEYIKDLNGGKAAIRAGYEKQSSQSQASRLLTKVKIRERINQLKKERSERTAIVADDLLEFYKRALTIDVLDVVNPDGSLKPLDEIPLEWRQMIESVEMKESGIKVTFVSKTEAARQFGKHLALFTDKVDVTVHLPSDEEAEKMLAEVLAAKAEQEQDDR